MLDAFVTALVVVIAEVGPLCRRRLYLASVLSKVVDLVEVENLRLFVGRQVAAVFLNGLRWGDWELSAGVLFGSCGSVVGQGQRSGG